MDQWTSPTPPTPVERPMLTQAWQDCSFLHWPCKPGQLRRFLPPSMELETMDGHAWVSLITFRIPRMRLGLGPLVPGMSRAAESHLRTYVKGPDGRRGIWFLSLGIQPPAAAFIGRFGFALPYQWAEISISRTGSTLKYSVRMRLGSEDQLDLQIRVGPPVPASSLGARDHFLTARWVLYGGFKGLRYSMLTEHPPWSFQEAEIKSLKQTMIYGRGLEPVSPPLLHYSPGLPAKLGWPRLQLAT